MNGHQPLAGRTALVAGATRGAGRAFAIELAAAGAFVYATGRSSQASRSEIDRPETIQETAARAADSGGEVVAVVCDHLDPSQVRQQHLGCRSPHRLGRQAVGARPRRGAADPAPGDRHSHHHQPCRDPAADQEPGRPRDRSHRWRRGVQRRLSRHSEAMLDHFEVTEENWREGTAKDPHFCISETPHYVARAAVALAADPDKARFSGQSLASWDLGPIYGVTDLDGTQPQMLKYHREVMEAGKPADDTGYR